MRAILAGGPKHGAIYEVRDRRDLIFAVNFPPGQIFIPGAAIRPPKPNRLMHPRRYQEWKNWKSPTPPECAELAFEKIVYRMKWQNPAENSAIYWYYGAITPPPDTANEIFHYIFNVYQEAGGANYNSFKGFHWEMGRDWYVAIHRAVLSNAPTLGFEYENDTLVGLPVKVIATSGAPRIVEDERIEVI